MVFKDRYDLPETVQKVGLNYPRNAKYAGKAYLPEELPDSIKTIYPDFTPYTIKAVRLDKFTNHYDDLRDANKFVGLKTKPDGYTWHHHEDRTTMQLVSEDLHVAFKHTGGMSTTKHGVNTK